jgi:hypothetical protein
MGLSITQYQDVYQKIGNPIRAHLLMYISEHPDTSPVQYHREHREEGGPSLNLTAYHFRALVKEGLIHETSIARGGRRRGGTECFFSLTQVGEKYAKLFVAA